MRTLAISTVGIALAVIAPQALAQVTTIRFDNVGAIPSGHMPMTGGYLHPNSQNFQEDGNHVEIFWVPNNATSFVQGHFHHVELGYEGSHGFETAAGFGPDLQGPYIRREDGAKFDLLGFNYRNRHGVATNMYFTEDLVPLPTLTSFTPVPVGPGTLWQAIDLDQFQDLDQLFMTVNLGTSSSQHFYWDNIRIGVVSDLAEDSFEHGSLNGGLGWSDDSWTTTGLVSPGVVTPAGGSARTVARIKNSGTMRRTIPMNGVINPRIHLDLMVVNYEGADSCLLQASADGVNFTTLREFTAADSDGQFYEYKFDLGFLGSVPSIEIALVANTTSPEPDYFFIDNVRVRGVDDGGSPPVADGGGSRTVYDLTGSGSVEFQLDASASFDPDGTIVRYEWTEGATLLGTTAITSVNLPYGEHFVTLTVEDNTGLISVDELRIYCSPGSLAFDGFESNNWSGGVGAWVGNWTQTGLTTTGAVESNSGIIARIRDTGSVSRTVDLSQVSFARLSMRYMVADYEIGDFAWVEVSSDGVNFTAVQQIDASESDRVWRSLDLDLSGFAPTSTFVIRVRTDTQITNARDYLHVDDVEVFGHRL